MRRALIVAVVIALALAGCGEKKESVTGAATSAPSSLIVIRAGPRFSPRRSVMISSAVITAS